MAKQKIKVIREEMLQVANNVAQEKSIDKDSVFEAMELALEKSARVKYGFERDIRVNINRENGDIKLSSYLEVVENLQDFRPSGRAEQADECCEAPLVFARWRCRRMRRLL